MAWQEISIKAPWEYVEPISYLFTRYGRGLSVENDGTGWVLLKTYLPGTSKHRRARIEVGINLMRRLQDLGDLIVEDLKEADWQEAWKAHFNLLKVGRNLVIKPSWIVYEAQPREVVIELDPGMAFGTGYHPTTHMCLEAMEELVRPGMDVLDLGCGSAILSIAAAKLGASSVVALDVDSEAVKVSRKNIRASGLGAVVRPAKGTLPHGVAKDSRFDIILANISARVIQEQAEYFGRNLKIGGILVASGFLEDKFPELRNTLTSAELSYVKSCYREDWVASLFTRGD